MSKLARWICPRCRDGKLAPNRPRKNDVRRYCLACSEKSGRLVERVSPKLERKRAKKKPRYYMLAGHDVSSYIFQFVCVT